MVLASTHCAAATVAPYTTLPAASLAERTEPCRWLAEGLFLESGAGILGGAPKSCKSYFALDLCVAVASGTPCAGRFAVAKAGPVLLLCAEDPPAVVSSRLTALAAGRGLSLQNLPIEVITEAIERLPDGLQRLTATVRTHAPRLVLLDPLIRLHRADENSASEMSVILDGLRSLARAEHTAVLLVHHARKAAATGGSGLRGSSDLHAFGDSNLYLRRLGQSDALELRLEHRSAASSEPLRMRLNVTDNDSAAHFTLENAAATEDGAAKRIVAQLEAAGQPMTLARLREKLGMRNQTIATALKTLSATGVIARSGRDGWELAATHKA